MTERPGLPLTPVSSGATPSEPACDCCAPAEARDLTPPTHDHAHDHAHDQSHDHGGGAPAHGEPGHTHWVADPAERERLSRKARLLARVSVTYNVLEAAVAIGAGLAARSVALLGFGLDSTIEVSSALIILWQFRHDVPESRERAALKALAVSFFALAAYVGFESVQALVTGERPATSVVGIGLAIASILVMPWLSRAQRRTGQALGSRAVEADGRQTRLCAYLSGVLLVGLGLNALFGWAWADPLAALVIAAVAVREGVEAWRGDVCDC